MKLAFVATALLAWMCYVEARPVPFTPEEIVKHRARRSYLPPTPPGVAESRRRSQNKISEGSQDGSHKVAAADAATHGIRRGDIPPDIPIRIHTVISTITQSLTVTQTKVRQSTRTVTHEPDTTSTVTSSSCVTKRIRPTRTIVHIHTPSSIVTLRDTKVYYLSTTDLYLPYPATLEPTQTVPPAVHTRPAFVNHEGYNYKEPATKFTHGRKRRSADEAAADWSDETSVHDESADGSHPEDEFVFNPAQFVEDTGEFYEEPNESFDKLDRMSRGPSLMRDESVED